MGREVIIAFIARRSSTTVLPLVVRTGALTHHSLFSVPVTPQNDFLPASDAPLGGRFGVAEGGSAVPNIVALINKFVEAKAVVVATRDYHPM